MHRGYHAQGRSQRVVGEVETQKPSQARKYLVGWGLRSYLRSEAYTDASIGKQVHGCGFNSSDPETMCSMRGNLLEMRNGSVDEKA